MSRQATLTPTNGPIPSISPVPWVFTPHVPQNACSIVLSAILGYARVSTPDQDVAGQIARLKDAGAARTFEDIASGKVFERPGLKAMLEYARADDAIMVVRLDRLGRSLRELLEIVEQLKTLDIARRRSTPRPPPANSSSTSSAPSPSSSAA